MARIFFTRRIASFRRPRIGVAFLARGFHPDWQHAFARFISSYRRFPAGIDHQLYVIFKGYRDAAHLAEAQACFADLPHVPLHTDDDGFDIGCYQRVAHQMPEEFVCFLNTKSEILCAKWLQKLAAHSRRRGVGLVGNTGSYESLHLEIPAVPAFPNPHIRTNAFLIRRELFSRIVDRLEFATKRDAWMFESGPACLSRQVAGLGLESLVVDRKGNAHAPDRWPLSNTYRTTSAAPLIGDDAYREFRHGHVYFRRDLAALTWGPAEAEARVRAGLGSPADFSRIAVASASIANALP